MDIDFSLLLVILVAVTGGIWGFDHFVLRPRRASTAPEPIVVEYAHSFFPVLALVLALRSFLLEPFTIPSASMVPSLEVGDYILVNKFAYGLRLPVIGTEIVPIGKPKRGDIMVFRFPHHPTTNYIKRVVGLPGDRIRFEEGHLFVNDKEVPRRLLGEQGIGMPWEFFYEENLDGTKHVIRQEAGKFAGGRRWGFNVPAGSYFMMGDNRDNSNDSRFWGPVAERYIVGKAFYIWMHKEPGLHLPGFDRNGKVY